MTMETAQDIIAAYHSAIQARSQWSSLPAVEKSVVLAGIQYIREEVWNAAMDRDLPAMFSMNIARGYEGWERFVGPAKLDELMDVLTELADPLSKAVGVTTHLKTGQRR